MKKANTWITIVAVLVLAAVGLYLLQENKAPEEKTYVEVIDGEEVVLNHPMTESFSNAESNKKNTQQVAGASTSVGSIAKKVAQKIAEPFILGFYYLKNLNGENLDTCEITSEDELETVEYPDYNEDNFKLTDLTFADDSAYLFVEADESPEGVCANISMFENLSNSFFKAIHVVVQ